jgi:phosphatidate cytidylyltransferase
MFKQRLLTALILIPLVLMAIYYANNATLALLVLLLIGALGWEWLQLIPIKHWLGRCAFITLLLFLIWPAVYWLKVWLIVDLIFWGLIFVAVSTFPASSRIWGQKWIVGSSCLLLLPPIASSIAALYQQVQGKDFIVYLLCLIWAADIGAYCAGKQWGQHKLIPMVSPGKTVEGAAGGIGLTIIVASIGFVYFQPSNVIAWFALAFGTAGMSMLGDLFISMLKRRSNIKDTGCIFPGHGGVLDRLDSLIAALPLFYLLYTLFF